jgi:hypothetical protein
MTFNLQRKNYFKIIRRCQVLVAHALILGMWGVEIGRITVQGQPRQIVCETPISKITRAKWTGGMPALQVWSPELKLVPPKKKKLLEADTNHKITEKETLLPVRHHGFIWFGYCILFNTCLFSVSKIVIILHEFFLDFLLYLYIFKFFLSICIFFYPYFTFLPFVQLSSAVLPFLF